MPKVSVIVPVYRVESYLHRCVDSILAQTFSDFELILVDDGSPDSCGAICDEYARQDSRIHVIHQENGGLSAARNAGIDWAFANSDSQWLTFVDSDDWLHPQMLEAMWNAAQKDDTSVVVCGHQQTQGETPEVCPEQLESSLWDPEDFYLQYTCNATLAWGKLYEKRYFETLRYPVGRIHEDEYLTYQILFRVPQISVIPAPLYAYYVNAEGITRSKWSPKRLDSWGAFEAQIRFFHETGRTELEKTQILVYLGNTKFQEKQIRRSGCSKEYAEELKLTKTRRQEILRALRQNGYTNVIRAYRKEQLRDALDFLFVWKEKLGMWRKGRS